MNGETWADILEIVQVVLLFSHHCSHMKSSTIRCLTLFLHVFPEAREPSWIFFQLSKQTICLDTLFQLVNLMRPNHSIRGKRLTGFLFFHSSCYWAWPFFHWNHLSTGYSLSVASRKWKEKETPFSSLLPLAVMMSTQQRHSMIVMAGSEQRDIV